LIGGPEPPGPTPWLCPCSRPQKTFPDRKKSGQLCQFCPVMPETEKKPDYYRLSGKVLLHPKLEP